MPKAIVITKATDPTAPTKPGEVYYPLAYINVPTPPSPLPPTKVLVQLSAAALNHRDFFIRQHLYPGVAFGVPLLADGCGTVVETGSSSSATKWKGKRVVINPGTGWKSAPEGPEGGAYATLGGTKFNPVGTLSEIALVEAEELEEAPTHLDDTSAAALPLAGLTAWRAFSTKSNAASPGKNILVTGIGGGVALMILMFGVAVGANVYVSSGDEAKLQKAMGLGAKGGVNYKDQDWDKKLLGLLGKAGGNKQFDAIIDGAGGSIVEKSPRLLKGGGVIVTYGMTLGPKMAFTMPNVLKNIELRGSTMGSRKEFAEMMAFVREKKLKPVVSQVVDAGKELDDIKAIDALFDVMRDGRQFGKLVIKFGSVLSGGEGSKL